MPKIEVRWVLAGAYKSGDTRSTLAHAVRDGKALCGRVRPESLADSGATSPLDEVTCGSCIAKLRVLASLVNDV